MYVFIHRDILVVGNCKSNGHKFSGYSGEYLQGLHVQQTIIDNKVLSG